jgi:flagellar export protein FliJ
MPFRFVLQSVLHFRQSLEHQQELRLRAANQQVARIQHLLEQVNAHRRRLHAEQNRQLTVGLTAAELRFELQCETELIKRQRQIESHLAQAQQLRDREREIFLQARRARETLEALRGQQFKLYRQEAARREQKNLDDLFLMRKERSSPS